MGLILADTNALIYFLKGYDTMIPYLNETYAISEITEIELLGIKNISKSDLLIRSNLIADCIIYPLTSEIKNIAIRIKQTHTLKIPDALIAATSIYFNIPLLTADKDFKKIHNLRLQLLNIP